jgi:hypothetical protein
MRIFSTASTITALTLVITFTSCRSSREYPERRYPERDRQIVIAERDRIPPGQAKKIYGDRSARGYSHGHNNGHNKRYSDYGRIRYRYPLIIVRTPDIIISRYNDGRYYYRNERNFMYWQGNDGRFYLEDQYLPQVEYDDNEYTDWKYKGNKYNDRRNDRRYDDRRDRDYNDRRQDNDDEYRDKEKHHGKGHHGKGHD